jgi:hypothetical protein
MPYGFTQDDWGQLNIDQREAIRLRNRGVGGEDDPLAWESAEVRPTHKLTYQEIAPERPEVEKPAVPGVVGEMASGMMPQIFTTPERQAGAAHEAQQLETQIAAAQQEKEAQAQATPSLLDPGAGQMAISATQARPIPLPTPAGLEEAQKERQEGYMQEIAAFGTEASAQQQLIKDLTDLQVTEAREARRLTGERQREYDKMQVEHRKREESRQTYIKGEMGKIQGVVDQLQTAKIDPYSFYKHPDGSVDYPKSIAAAIAVGLGALGASLPAQYGGTGGPNVALQIIDKAIDREIQAQRDDIANRRAGVGIQMNLLTQMRGVLDDERLDDKGAELALLKTYELKLQDALMQTRDQKVQLNGEMMLSQLKEREAGVLSEIINRANDKWVEDEKIQYGIERQTVAAMAKAQAPAAAWREPQAFPAPPGLEVLPGYKPASKKEWEEDRKLSKKAGSAYYEAMGELQKMLAWRRKYGAKLSPEMLSKVKTEGQVYLNRSKSAMRKVDDTGARLDAGEIEMMGLMDNIGKLGHVETQIMTVMQSVTDKMNGRMKPLGHRLRPAARIQGEAAAQ